MDQPTIIQAYATVSGMADTKRAEAKQYPVGSHDWCKYFDQAEALSKAALAVLNMENND
jgi:hypothetical protein